MTSTLDDAFRALANPVRRRLLVALGERNPRADGALDVPEEVPVEGRSREELHVELHHDHLPRLEEADLVRWDRDAQQVTRGPALDEVRPILELLPDNAHEPATHE